MKPMKGASEGRGARAEGSLEELVGEALELEDQAREAWLIRLEDVNESRAREVRDLLAELDALGMVSSSATEASGSESEHLGGFRLFERIGGGGMGDIWFARDPSGGPAAIKRLRADHAWSPVARGRFARETQSAGRLRHPGIVRVLSSGHRGPGPWIAMEWIGGASLEEIVARVRDRAPGGLRRADFHEALLEIAGKRPCPDPPSNGAFQGRDWVEVVTLVIARVADALAEAHERGVVHRDVKPSNVLVTPSGRVVLVDFGLALHRSGDRMTRTGSWLGTLPYAAPEQVLGAGEPVDARVDLYGLGATLYELLTLRTPFLGGTEDDVRRRIRTGDVEFPRRSNPAVSLRLERVWRAAMDCDPDRRHGHAGELAEDLRRAIDGGPLRARTLPPWIRLRRLVSRRPRSAVAALVGCLVVVASFALVMRERAALNRVLRLSDAADARRLLVRAESFWPADPDQIEAMDVWIEGASKLLEREEKHGQDLAALRTTALPYRSDERERDRARHREDLATLLLELEGMERLVQGGDRMAHPHPPGPEVVVELVAALESGVTDELPSIVAGLEDRLDRIEAMMREDSRQWDPDMLQLDDLAVGLRTIAEGLGKREAYSFRDGVSQWRHDTMVDLLRDLSVVRENLPLVRRQRELTARMLQDMQVRTRGAWTRACESISRSASYGGLRLAPVFGLEPIEMNPKTGLWEFLVLGTGDPPSPDPVSGSTGVSEGTGIVMILLPGGRFRMGDSIDGSFGQPVHEVELTPFFVSKYELTRGQVARLGGVVRTQHWPGPQSLPASVSWFEADEVLARSFLRMPTEAQWEYAARGMGSDDSLLEGSANVRDEAWARYVEGTSGMAGLQPYERLPFDDGYAGPAPVGSFPANGFGLHDVVGNLEEWCVESWVRRSYSTLPSRPGDGRKQTILAPWLRAVRGGSYMDVTDRAHVGRGKPADPGKPPKTTGVRPVLALPAP